MPWKSSIVTLLRAIMPYLSGFNSNNILRRMMQTPPVTKPHTLGGRAHRASFHLLSTTEEEEPQKEGGDPAGSRERASDGSPLSPDILANSIPWGPSSRCPGGQIPPEGLSASSHLDCKPRCQGAVRCASRNPFQHTRGMLPSSKPGHN